MSEMAATTQGDTLLGGLGKTLGIPNLEFDEKNYCCLAFDDVVLNIELDRTRREILVYSEVAPLAANMSADRLLDILQANHYATLTGSGSVGIDRSAGRIYFSDRMLYEALEAKSFEARISEFVDRVEGWQRFLAEADNRTVSTAVHVVDLGMLRV
jgi:hypothetical protein